MSKLYQLTDEYAKLLNKEEFTKEDEELLSSLSGSIKDKCLSIAKQIKNLETEQNGILEAMQNMSDRNVKIQNSIQFLRDYIVINMRKSNIEVLKSPEFDIKISQNAAGVHLIDETILPDKFIRKVTKVLESVDKISIKEAIENGEEVPGAVLRRNLKLTIK